MEVLLGVNHNGRFPEPLLAHAAQGSCTTNLSLEAKSAEFAPKPQLLLLGEPYSWAPRRFGHLPCARARSVSTKSVPHELHTP